MLLVYVVLWVKCDKNMLKSRKNKFGLILEGIFAKSMSFLPRQSDRCTKTLFIYLDPLTKQILSRQIIKIKIDIEIDISNRTLMHREIPVYYTDWSSLLPSLYALRNVVWELLKQKLNQLFLKSIKTGLKQDLKIVIVTVLIKVKMLFFGLNINRLNEWKLQKSVFFSARIKQDKLHVVTFY